MTFQPVRRVLLLLLAVLGGAGALARPSTDIDDSAPSLAGQFLVASRTLEGPVFRQTVIYMVHHDASGAMGLVINKVMGTGSLARLAEALGRDVERQPESDAVPLHFGGPVEQELGFVLHSTDYEAEATVRVNGRVALTTDVEILVDMATGQGPEHAIVALGYAGWGANQLEGEIAGGAWYIIPGDVDLLFDDGFDDKWERAYSRRGVNL